MSVYRYSAKSARSQTGHRGFIFALQGSAKPLKLLQRGSSGVDRFSEEQQCIFVHRKLILASGSEPCQNNGTKILM